MPYFRRTDLLHASPISQDEPAGLALHGTELKDFLKPVPQQLRERFFDIKVLYSRPLYEFILKRNKDPGNISMKLRYLGLDAQNTEPHIVIQCEKRVAKKVKKFFSQKHVEEELLPDFRVLVLNKPPIEVANDDTVDVFSDSLPDETMCGMPIILSGGGKSVRCSLGGVIIVETDQSRLYGLIAGHPLKRIRADLSGKQPPYETYGLSSLEEGEDDSDSDGAPTDISVMPSKSVHSDIERTNDDHLLRTKLSIGTIICDTFSIPLEENLDWALIALNQEYALPNLVVRNEQSKEFDFLGFKTEICYHRDNSLRDTGITKEVLVLKQGEPCMAELMAPRKAQELGDSLGYTINPPHTKAAKYPNTTQGPTMPYQGSSSELPYLTTDTLSHFLNECGDWVDPDPMWEEQEKEKGGKVQASLQPSLHPFTNLSAPQQKHETHEEGLALDLSNGIKDRKVIK
ncbi:hypothetical protein FLAG1_06047 [Fusarium langsethiae]|uniref:Uncharacterized protein n=1 Tax=Fusarium langsethiae TaxID=179993 RepID=A0A0M9EWJ1_FUSLA|nr:hypothetical protein FLAG1_06047 [Fusarium langsethiae]